MLQSEPDISPRHGFTESKSEVLLRDWVEIASAFTNSLTALALRDETGIWYWDGYGLTTEQRSILGSAIVQDFSLAFNAPLLQGLGLQLIDALPLVDEHSRAIGYLFLLSPIPFLLSTSQRDGLRVVIDHIQATLAMDRERMETRSIPRAPSATSFVPGLVHELRNFIFGISANLDALAARFAAQDEVKKYGVSIRRSLDRLNAFIEELRDYGDPQMSSWANLELEPIIREALEQFKPRAVKSGVDLQFRIIGTLPLLAADERSLRGAFIRLIDLALQQEEMGGRVDLQVGVHLQGESRLISGYLDSSNLKLKDLDLHRLFEPFYFRASGLGHLALPGARRIFESHGGSLTAGAGPEGGLRIIFLLPTV